MKQKFFNWKMRMKSLWQKAAALKQKTAVLLMMILSTAEAYAQDTTSGAGAISQVATDIAKYIEPVQTLLYAIAGVVALGGAISVFIKMNNEEQDVKKSIMLLIGACIFLIAAAQALPLFFGL